MTVKKRRIDAADGLTYTEVSTISRATATPDDLRAVTVALDPLANIEAMWRPHAPLPHAKPKHQSRAWYANEILFRIALVHRHLDQPHRSRDDIEAIVYQSIHVGYLHGTAWWRFNLGDQTRRGVNTLAHVRAIARHKRERRLGSCDPTIVIAEAKRLRAKHPYSRAKSTRWLAEEIARSQSYAYGTVRRRLDEIKFR